MFTDNSQQASNSTVDKFHIRLFKITSVFLINIFNNLRSYRDFILSFLSVLVFFLPSLQNQSLNNGMLYTGDILAYYVPALIKTHALLFNHHFSAIDYSLFNGSSDFFLNANFFPFHPLVVLHSLLISSQSVSTTSTGHFLVLMMAFHLFLACYFSLKLFTHYFSFEFRMSVLIATGFAFSWYMVASMGEPPFLFCASIIPWTIYGSLRCTEALSLRTLLWSTIPIIIGILGGYLPLGLTALTMSAILIAATTLFFDRTKNNNLEQCISSLFIALAPFLLGLLITSPYLYAVYKFHHQTTGSLAPNLFSSAYQLAELPQSFIRVISSHFVVPGPFFEFSVYWGIIALTIFAVFFLSGKTASVLNEREWKIFKVTGIGYFAIVLAIYGQHSAISSLVYYFVPQIGKMHIYQRFLQPAQLLLMIMIALMLKAIIESQPKKSLQVSLFILTSLSFGCGFLMTYRSEYALMFGINNYLLFELILACLFSGLLLIPGRAFAYYGTTILLCLPTLNMMYALSSNNNTFVAAEQRQPMTLNHEAQMQLLQYLKRFSNKTVIKYVDTTPLWSKDGIEPFPKTFPYLVLEKVNLSSYGGATFYHSALAEYLHRMPVEGSQVTVKPDWHWLQETEADFLLATKEELATNELIKNVAHKNKPEDLYYLPNDVVLIPLKLKDSTRSILYDNGYFRICSSTPSTQNSINLALHKPAKQSGTVTGAPAELVVDGNTDGNFSHGTVSHTSKDQNAWLDIDIEKTEHIDSIKIWNRTDCCSDRLTNYWVFISKNPFLSTDTVSSLRNRTETWGILGYPTKLVSDINTKGIEGRYIRIQLSGDQLLENSYLHLAEVEVFKAGNSNTIPTVTKDPAFKIKNFFSNDATYIKIEFQADTPTVLQYLFWNNPRIKYYLNRKKVSVRNSNGLISIDAPAGKNIVEVHYIHWPLMLFWFFYALFAVALIFSFIPKSLIAKIKSNYQAIRGIYGSKGKKSFSHRR